MSIKPFFTIFHVLLIFALFCALTTNAGPIVVLPPGACCINDSTCQDTVSTTCYVGEFHVFYSCSEISCADPPLPCDGDCDNDDNLCNNFCSPLSPNGCIWDFNTFSCNEPTPPTTPTPSPSPTPKASPTPSPTPTPTGSLGCCEGVRGNPCVDGLDPSNPDTNQERCENNRGTWSLGEVCDNNHQCNAPVNPDHLMCYQVKDPLQLPKERDPKTIFVSVPQFGSEVRCVLKGRSRLFCAPACKTKQGDPPVGAGLCQPDAENPQGFDRVCYNVENCGEISGQIDELEVAVTDQFDDISISTEGPRLYTNFNPHQICTPALKCTGGCEDRLPGAGCRPNGPTVTRQTYNCDLGCQCVPEECGDGIIGPNEDCESEEDCFVGDDIGPTIGSVCIGCRCDPR